MPRPERLYGVARQVLDLVAAALDATPAGAPDRRYVSDGPLVAWDCEQLVVAVEGTVSHDGDLMVETPGPVNCLVMRAATLGVWIVRCAPTVEDDGTPPPADDIDANAAVMLADPTVMLDAIVTAYQAGELAGAFGLALLGWDGVGPEGGLVGGVLRVRVDLTAV